MMKPKPPLIFFFALGFILVTVFFFMPSAKIFAQKNFAADDINGEWWTLNNEGKMIFFRSNGKYYGMVSWLKFPNDEDGKPRCDKHNPDPSLRSRPLQNLILFSDFAFDEKKEKYVGGMVYDAGESGKKYACWLKLTSRNVLEIHGYIGFSLLGKSVYFTRVQK
jgi:uncharacterized protein (DUF2147 family)